MIRSLAVLVALMAFACSSPSSETAADSTDVATDTVALSSTEDPEVSYDEPSDDDTAGDDPNTVGVYEISDGWSYISNPFAFALDSATIMELLGSEATIASAYTPPAEAGDDGLGGYDGFWFYEVTYGDTKLSFYSYSGKHFADIVTPLLPMTNGIRVGMTKEEFLEKMSLTASDDTEVAEEFEMTDDYGSMTFYFDGEKLVRVYVRYEEGD